MVVSSVSVIVISRTIDAMWSCWRAVCMAWRISDHRSDVCASFVFTGYDTVISRSRLVFGMWCDGIWSMDLVRGGTGGYDRCSSGIVGNMTEVCVMSDGHSPLLSIHAISLLV